MFPVAQRVAGRRSQVSGCEIEAKIKFGLWADLLPDAYFFTRYSLFDIRYSFFSILPFSLHPMHPEFFRV